MNPVGSRLLEVQASRLSGQLGQDLQIRKPYASWSHAGLWAAVLGAERTAGTAWAGLCSGSCVSQPVTQIAVTGAL